MTTNYTTRVWDCWDAVYDALAAADWPTHPLTSKVPKVQFSGSRDVAKEMITVPGMKIPEGPVQDFATLGNVGRDETFTLVVFGWSEVAGFVDTTKGGDASRVVRDRIRELSAIAESTFRDITTGRPKGISVPGVWAHGITSLLPSVAPIEGGYGAQFNMEITFLARI
jgi:hypothetical protein